MNNDIKQPTKRKSVVKGKWVSEPWDKLVNLVTMHPVQTRWIDKY